MPGHISSGKVSGKKKLARHISSGQDRGGANRRGLCFSRRRLRGEPHIQ